MHRAVLFLSSGSLLASTETCARVIIHLPVRVCWSALARVLSGEFRCELGFEGGRASAHSGHGALRWCAGSPGRGRAGVAGHGKSWMACMDGHLALGPS